MVLSGGGTGMHSRSHQSDSILLKQIVRCSDRLVWGRGTSGRDGPPFHRGPDGTQESTEGEAWGGKIGIHAAEGMDIGASGYSSVFGREVSLPGPFGFTGHRASAVGLDVCIHAMGNEFVRGNLAGSQRNTCWRSWHAAQTSCSGNRVDTHPLLSCQFQELPWLWVQRKRNRSGK